MSKLVCTHRKLIHIPEKKNRSALFSGTEHFPPSQESRLWVDCGKCYACKLKRKNQWTTRLATHFKLYPKNVLWSLFTYNNETVPAFNELGKKRFQLFMKRFRRYLEYHFNHKGVKYFCAGEYGEKNHRPHFHCIMYNLPNLPCGRDVANCPAIKLRLELLWKQGYVKTKALKSVKQIFYTCKYAVKGLSEHDNSKPCILFSKGLGLEYVKKNYEKIRKIVTNPLKLESPYIVMGKFRFFLDSVRTWKKHIYTEVEQLYRFVHFRNLQRDYEPDSGHSPENREKWLFSLDCEEKVRTYNATWRKLLNVS